MSNSGLTITCPTVLTHPDAKPPTQATVGAVGHDLACVAGVTGLDPQAKWSAEQKNVWAMMETRGYVDVLPQQTIRLRLGFKQAIQDGYAARFDDRSGMGVMKSMKILGGIIDSDYRGEWVVGLVNLSNIIVRINVGDNVAQCLYYPKISAHCPVVTELSDTERGSGGFGSTDKKE